LRLKIILPVLLIPLLAVGALFSGILPASGFGPLSTDEVKDALTEADDTLSDVVSDAVESVSDAVAEAVDDAAPTADAGTGSEAAAADGGGAAGSDGEAEGDGAAEADGATSEEQAADTQPEPVAVELSILNGYLAGAEHGVALIQTTRRISPIHQGWVDITLDLALTLLERNAIGRRSDRDYGKRHEPGRGQRRRLTGRRLPQRKRVDQFLPVIRRDRSRRDVIENVRVDRGTGQVPHALRRRRVQRRSGNG
jgi:hypothetical protein